MTRPSTLNRPAAVLCSGALMLGCGSGLVRLDAKRVRSVRVVLVDGGETACPTGPTPARVPKRPEMRFGGRCTHAACAR